MCNVYFILTLIPPWLQLEGHKIQCSLLLRHYLTKFSNADANLPREQCRFATYTTFWPSPLHDCRSKLRYTSILWILMGSSLCSLLFRNYSTDFSNADANLSSEQCRFATYTSFWPSPLHDCRSRSHWYADICRGHIRSRRPTWSSFSSIFAISRINLTQIWIVKVPR